MSSIGIIANPASGKDIRRLVSYATTIDNREKVNIIIRLIIALEFMGCKDFYFMPDTFNFESRVMEQLSMREGIDINYHTVDVDIFGDVDDTIRAAKIMEDTVDVIVVLGGDGTSRAVAKSIVNTPIFPISTGTNNVYPYQLEGTVAGMAIGCALKLQDREDIDPSEFLIRDKRIEIYVNDEFTDLALVDMVITKDLFPGAKAIWDVNKIEHIVLSRCHPTSIGFSSVGGCHQIIDDTEDRGLSINMASSLEDTKLTVSAPIAAGTFEEVKLQSIEQVELDKLYDLETTKPCMIAVDGEREVRINKGDTLSYKLTRNGPLRIRYPEILELAVDLGLL